MPDWKTEIRKQLAGLQLAPEREAEIIEELSHHLNDRYDDLLAGGATPEQARQTALAELHDDTGLRQELRQIEEQEPQERPVSGASGKSNLLADFWQDLRYAFRMLRKSPSFTAVAVLSLALGIGANTAIFSVLNMVLLRPLPIAKPEQLVAVNNTSERRMFPAISYPNYKDFRDRNEVFSGLIGYNIAQLSLSYDGISDRLWGYEVTGNYFGVLGIQPALGRLISPDDDQTPGGHPLTVISYKCWRQRFGGDANVIGKEVTVNGRNYTVIGVLPEGFFGTEIIAAPDMWFPMAMQAQLEMGADWLNDREAETLSVQGRLKPGVQAAQAQAALDSIAVQLESEYPAINQAKRVTISSPSGMFSPTMRAPVLGFAGLLMAVVGLVLLLACANLANLLLARATERRKEIAVRLALGASRFRLVRQLLTESVLLAGLGGIVGLLPAFWLVGLATSIKMPINVPVVFDLRVDYRVLIFTFLLSLATGVLFGLLPALQTTKTDMTSALKGEMIFDGRRALWRGLSLKNALIVLQIALSLVLLVGGGLMLRALRQAQSLSLGFEPQNAIEVSFDLRLQGYENARGREFQKQVLERIRALPGVESAGITDMPPVDLHFSRRSVFIEGETPSRNAPQAFTNRASPGYFQAMETRLIKGRDFTEQDDDKAVRVAIVNETLARSFWPGQDPLGKRFRLGDSESPNLQVVGVVEDGKYAGLSESPKPFVCRPIWQSYSGATSLIVRTTADPESLIAAVRGEVRQLDPNLPMASRTRLDALALPLLPARIAAYVLGGFGALALALAGIGIYGVTSYSVVHRTHEIGIRMALGAQRGDILKLMIGQGMALAFTGLGLGLLAALGLTRWMSSLLFGISPTDPLTYTAVALLLAGVTLLAYYLPSRRATKIDPMAALRHE